MSRYACYNWKVEHGKENMAAYCAACYYALTKEREGWKKAHDDLVYVRQADLAALQAKLAALSASPEDPAVADALNAIQCGRQCDPDGVDTRVSREAVDIVVRSFRSTLVQLAEARAKIEELNRVYADCESDANRMSQHMNDCQEDERQAELEEVARFAAAQRKALQDEHDNFGGDEAMDKALALPVPHAVQAAMEKP